MFSPARVRLYGLALFAIGLPLFPVMLQHIPKPGSTSDWRVFYTAASTVGTRTLLDPTALAPFVYLPGAAWLLEPAKYLSLAWSYAANAVVMLAICILCGVVAAKTYRLNGQSAVIGVLAWAPATAAIVVGQNSPVGLLLIFLSIFGLTRERSLITGLAVGMLLYKPTYAIPLVLLLLVFRRWGSLAVVGACSAGWYLLSVAATAGDWAWPITYVHVIAAYAAPDFAFNASKAISIPGMLLRLGVPPHIGYAIGGSLLIGSIFLFRRVTVLEAASAVTLIGLAASPHALQYDAVLVLPSIFYAVTHLADPWRTRLICAAYLIAPLWQLGPTNINFDVLAVIVIGAAVGWCYWQAASFVPRADLTRLMPLGDDGG